MFKLSNSISNTIIRMRDYAQIPTDPDNIDYQEYLAWLADGNTPLPADLPLPPPPPGPSVEERLEAAEALIDMILEAGEEITNG